VLAKNLAGTALGYYGWHLVVKADSKIKDAGELAGKKVGITSAGSGTDILALWTQADRKIQFTRVPLAAAGWYRTCCPATSTQRCSTRR